MSGMDPISSNLLKSRFPISTPKTGGQKGGVAGLLKQDSVEIGMGGPPTMEKILELLTNRINSQIENLFPGTEGITIDEATLSMDWSPEAVSGKIVDFATSFFGAFQTEHPELGGEESVKGFMSLIRDAIEEGFKQAKDILGAMSVLEGGVTDTVDQTYGLTMEKLDAFETRQRESPGIV